MARRQGHAVDSAGFHAVTIKRVSRRAFDLIDDLRDLVDRLAILRRPRAPLRAVCSAKIAAVRRHSSQI